MNQPTKRWERGASGRFPTEQQAQAPQVAQVVAVQIETGPFDAKAYQRLLQRTSELRGVAYVLVSNGRSEKCAYFPTGGLRLSSLGARQGRGFLESLLAHDYVAARPEVGDVLRDIVASGSDVAEVLLGTERLEGALAGRLDMHLAAGGLREAAQETSRRIIRDELLDLALWDGAVYEFAESNPPPEIFKPKLGAAKLSLGVKPLLEEVRQLIPEVTQLEQSLGKVATGTVALGPHAPGRLEPAEQAVLAAAGERGCSLETALVTLRRAGLDVLDAGRRLGDLAGQGVLQLGQQARNADARAAQLRADVALIEEWLELLISPLLARRKLADNYMALGRQDEAMGHLEWVGEELLKRGQTDEAVDIYRRIVQLNPKAFFARERIASIYERLGRVADAVAELLALAKEYAQLRLFNRAQQKYRQAIRLDPEQDDHRRRLIGVLQVMGDKRAAAREYHELADRYQGKGQTRRSMACYQKIQSLDPEDLGARRKLRELLKRGLFYYAPLLVSIAGLIVLGFVSLLIHQRYMTMRDFADAREQALAHAHEKRFVEARDALAAFTAVHPVYQPERVKAVEAEIDELALHEARVTYRRAAALDEAGKVLAAMPLYKRVEALAPESEVGDKARRRLQELESKQLLAEEMADRVRGLTQERAYPEALNEVRRLLRQLPWTRASQTLKLPLQVRSTPLGAKLHVNGEAAGDDLVYELAGAPVRLTLSLPGYETLTKAVDLRQEELTSPLLLELKRELRFRLDTLGPLLYAPAVGREEVVLGGGDERVYAVDLQGRVRWTHSLELFSQLGGRPLHLGDSVVLVDAAGNMTCLSVLDGTPRWGPVSWKEPPSLIGLQNDRLLVSTRTWLLAIDPRTGRRVDGFGARLPALKAGPDLRGDSLLALAESGEVLEFDARSGQPKSLLRLGQSAQLLPQTARQRTFATNGDQLTCYLGGRVAWVQRLPAPARSMTLTERLLVVEAGPQLIALSPEKGRQVWRQPLTAQLCAEPVAHSGRLYEAAIDGRLTVRDEATGQVRWSYLTDDALAAPPVVQGGTVYLPSTDHTLYGITDSSE